MRDAKGAFVKSINATLKETFSILVDRKVSPTTAQRRRRGREGRVEADRCVFVFPSMVRRNRTRLSLELRFWEQTISIRSLRSSRGEQLDLDLSRNRKSSSSSRSNEPSRADLSTLLLLVQTSLLLRQGGCSVVLRYHRSDQADGDPRGDFGSGECTRRPLLSLSSSSRVPFVPSTRTTTSVSFDSTRLSSQVVKSVRSSFKKLFQVVRLPFSLFLSSRLVSFHSSSSFLAETSSSLVQHSLSFSFFASHQSTLQPSQN